jgi:hypothetical protein
LTGKLNIAEALPFLGIVWLLTTMFGINGAAIGWSLRCTVDAFALIWLAGMLRADLLFALAPRTRSSSRAQPPVTFSAILWGPHSCPHLSPVRFRSD